MTDLTAALKHYFGFETFRPGQLEVMQHLLAGRSAAAVFPTGSGKSLCYQLPALMLPGVTLVVSPLIALMKDQIDALAARGIPARRLDSTLAVSEYREVMQQVHDGSLRLLYVAPERFQNERFREAIVRSTISLMAVDEAHCISEWGHNFRPDYLKLVEFARKIRAERMLALTATASPQVLDDMCRAFAIDASCAVRTGFYRSNLTIQTTPVDTLERERLLLHRLRERKAGPTIVYVTLQRTAEQVAARLAESGVPARPYHAGLDDDIRAAVQDWFLGTPSGVVVATIAFGMGIDKSDIRYVYHYNLPKSLENYAQEIGRSGRDGCESTCEMLATLDDLNTLENFTLGDTPNETDVRGLVDELFSAGAEFDVSFYELSMRHDIRLLVVRTLLTYLELEGWLEGGTPYFNEYRFKPLTSSRAILSGFDGERKRFLEQVFRQSKMAKTWCHLDVASVAIAIGQPRQRIVTALDFLAEQGYVELQADGMRHRYRVQRTPSNNAALATQLHQRSLAHEQRELARLNQVVQLVTQNECQSLALCRHFGETRGEPCGHCTWCMNGQQATVLAARHSPVIDEAIMREVKVLRSRYSAVLGDGRSLTRFLCGVTSPKLSRAKLTSHSLFGVLSHVPFRDLLARFNGAASLAG